MMFTNIRRALLVLVFSAIASTGSFLWADHGHGGRHGGRGFDGDHGHGGFSHFGGHSGWGGRLGIGLGFNSGYRNYGWPYSYGYYPYRYYRPYSYSYFGYPYLYGYSGYPSTYYSYPSFYPADSYPSPYSAYPSSCDGCQGDYASSSNDYDQDDARPTTDGEYVVSRPVSDVARVEFRLPDPQATIWVQGKEVNSSGTVRQFQTPQLDPTQQYTYTVRAQWHDNGKLFEEQKQVKVQPNALAVVDFTRPSEAASDNGPALSDLPPPKPRD